MVDFERKAAFYLGGLVDDSARPNPINP